MAGILLWIGTISSLGAVVMMTQQFLPSLSTHRPAKPKTSSPLTLIQKGVLPDSPFCHSKKKLAGMIQRWNWKAFLNVLLSARPSARALISSLIPFLSLAHPGVNPHLISSRELGL